LHCGQREETTIDLVEFVELELELLELELFNEALQV